MDKIKIQYHIKIVNKCALKIYLKTLHNPGASKIQEFQRENKMLSEEKQEIQITVIITFY